MNCLCDGTFTCSVCQDKKSNKKEWGLIEISKTEGFILLGKFDSKEKGDEEMANQISIWTHWNLPGCPCQKEFAVLEIA